MAARNLCEDFAPRNEVTRLCGGRGANRAAEKAAGGRWRRRTSVKILLPGTKQQGFAGSGEQIAPRKCRPAGMRRRGISVKFLLPQIDAPKNSGRITSTAANEFKNSLFCVLFRSLFLHNLRQRLSLKLFKQDFLDSAKLLMESARGVL